jgi:NAD(P)-dependent dehydrogenase (short-subunit alcohol dehydrogenase family)
MAEEILIKPKVGPFFRTFLYSQLFRTPQFPTQSFADKTVIVTGANVGLGLEAARHFYRLNCAKLIIAVRTISKGQTAKEEILRTVKERTDPDAIEIWALDLSSTASTIAFSERINKELPRVDVLVENAGINNKTLVVSENVEQTMQVNVINTFLLALLLLPKLTETAKVAKFAPHLTIVTSEAHHLAKFPQINTPDIYESLNDEKSFNGQTS